MIVSKTTNSHRPSVRGGTAPPDLDTPRISPFDLICGAHILLVFGVAGGLHASTEPTDAARLIFLALGLLPLALDLIYPITAGLMLNLPFVPDRRVRGRSECSMQDRTTSHELVCGMSQRAVTYPDKETGPRSVMALVIAVGSLSAAVLTMIAAHTSEGFLIAGAALIAVRSAALAVVFCRR